MPPNKERAVVGCKTKFPNVSRCHRLLAESGPSHALLIVKLLTQKMLQRRGRDEAENRILRSAHADPIRKRQTGPVIVPSRFKN
jgi:hypothetical protein